MLRASACFLFIVGFFSIAAAVAYLLIHAVGLSGLAGYLMGAAVFVAIVTAGVMSLAAINDRINK